MKGKARHLGEASHLCKLRHLGNARQVTYSWKFKAPRKARLGP
jgi:hypothetical protein